MVKLKRSQFNMNIFREMSVSVNRSPHRDVEIHVTDEFIFIRYVDNRREALVLEKKNCCPCSYDLGPSEFEFFEEELYIKLRFGRRDDKNNFWKLVFPYWQCDERNVKPVNTPATTPSPPLVPPNLPASTPSPLLVPPNSPASSSETSVDKLNLVLCA